MKSGIKKEREGKKTGLKGKMMINEVRTGGL